MSKDDTEELASVKLDALKSPQRSFADLEIPETCGAKTPIAGGPMVTFAKRALI